VSIAWDSSGNFKTDSNAYLFSLRVNAVSTSIKYHVTHSAYAINCKPTDGPTFGFYSDINISDHSNLNQNSYTKCHCYECPSGVPIGSLHSQLAGSNYFQVSEIEVFQIV
jgi:hypothetical protein